MMGKGELVRYYLLVKLNKKEQKRYMILIRQGFKNCCVTIIEIFEKEKKKKKDNMQGTDIRTCLMRKNKKNSNREIIKK